MKTNDFEFKTLSEIASQSIAHLRNVLPNCYGCDLHSVVYNEDYYIIGRYKAEQWLVDNTGVFNAIGIVQDYETEQFGQVSTDLSEPERVVNMIVYIIGELILAESKTLQDKWDETLSDEDCELIAQELEAEFIND